MTASKLNIRPTSGYALIEPVELEKQTASGIVLPDNHDEKSQKGKVVALGKALKDKSGKIIEPEVKIGDMVIYKKWGGDEIKLDSLGKEFIFVKFEDILAVLS
jgi:chaperonin GroES